MAPEVSFPSHSFISLFNLSVASLRIQPVHKDLCSQVYDSGETVPALKIQYQSFGRSGPDIWSTYTESDYEQYNEYSFHFGLLFFRLLQIEQTRSRPESLAKRREFITLLGGAGSAESVTRPAARAAQSPVSCERSLGRGPALAAARCLARRVGVSRGELRLKCMPYDDALCRRRGVVEEDRL